MEDKGKPTPIVTISDLPEEIIENILSFVNAYADFWNVGLVCKRWRRICQGIAKRIELDLRQNIETNSVKWSQHETKSYAITERYSHTAAYLDGFLYVFGGCTSTNTTFNDMWKFDLATRTWNHPICHGRFPTPKGHATMVKWKDQLIVFGGWYQSTPGVLNQYDDVYVHRFDTTTNTWATMGPPPSTDFPKSVAGHSACILPDTNYMLIYGGSISRGQCIGEVGVFDLETCAWRQLFNNQTDQDTPQHRHCASHMSAISSNQLVLFGGFGNTSLILSDCWLLTVNIENETFIWREIETRGAYTGDRLWCHPSVRVGDRIVVPSKTSLEIDNEVLDRISSYRIPPPCNTTHSSSSDEEQPVTGTGRVDRRRRQLDMLDKLERRLKNRSNDLFQERQKYWLKCPMYLHSLDISTILQGYATWLPVNTDKVQGQVPEDLFFYSINEGRGELILFGGLDPQTPPTMSARGLGFKTSNSVYTVQSIHNTTS